jgi:hypothetical protein
MYGLGPVERQCRRALIAKYPHPITVRDLMAWSYSGAEPKYWHRRAVHRAIKKFGIVVGKTGNNGRANLWMPNAELERQITRSARP